MSVRSLLFGLVALLAACGPLSEGTPGAGLIARFVPTPAAAAAGAPAPALTRAAIDASPTELSLFATVSNDAVALAQLAGTNGDKKTWLTADGIGITTANGLIVATRSLGDDLMGADVADVRGALRRGGGEATRVLDFMDGNDQIIRRTFLCTVTAQEATSITIVERQFSVRRMVESCASRDASFENQYWISADGIIWQSRQWVSAGVGYIDNQRLR